MTRYIFDMMCLLEGYVRNYRRLNLYQATNSSMFTKREIDYFANVGESLGFFSFVEDYKPNKKLGRSRPMDLAWWKLDERVDKDNFAYLVLHLERENQSSKDLETIDKLFAHTETAYIPKCVIGIQNVENSERVLKLNEIVMKRNKQQKSNVLMIYRFYDKKMKFDRVWAYHFYEDNVIEERKMISDIDSTGCWFMCFEEEYKPQNNGE